MLTVGDDKFSYANA